MNKPTFSIIIPAYNREATIERCLRSVINQTYDASNYEIILVDDGSTDKTFELGQAILSRNEGRIAWKWEQSVKNRGRLHARNRGMEVATKEWVCWLDSDDEYVSTYLEIIANAIERNPEAEIFNFGAIVYDEQNIRSYLRDTFMPGLRTTGRGHDLFKSGGIGSGSFVFRKVLTAETGLLPEAANPYGGDNSLPALAVQRYPELGTLYGKNEEGDWLPFGNPWGDDFLMFFMLTRNHISIPLDVHPYIQHVRH